MRNHGKGIPTLVRLLLIFPYKNYLFDKLNK